MKKLELKDIACYLPYNLMVLHEEHLGLNDCSAKKINAINVCSGTIEIIQNGSWMWTDNFRPILRPMSDLINFIIVNGYNNDSPFIPLIEMAKYAYSEIYNAIGHFNYDIEELRANPKSNGAYEIGHFSYKDGTFEMLEYGEIIKRNKNDMEPFVEIVHNSLNQYKYFDLLNQWHFDYRNLIHEGLAVDINTINK